MNYDTDAPFAVTKYRHMQKAFPGADGLYALTTAYLQTSVPDDGRVLVVGAGGGREIENLTASSNQLQIVGVDPSADMLSIAQWYVEQSKAEDRVTLIQGTVKDLDEDTPPFDAATSLLVMHFLPDDDSDKGKRAYLQAIRNTLRLGAILVLADISVEHGSDLDRIEPVFLQHARAQGLTDEEMRVGPATIRKLPILNEARTMALLSETGFSPVQRFFQTLWYKAWITTAV